MAIDFSFPAWLRDQHSFADSLAKGAQVGAIIANNRYRNQALAAQAIQAEREYVLRERQLEAQERTDDLNFRLRSQLIEDQTADKAAISDWIQKRNELSLEERIGMAIPDLRLPQSYQIANQVSDNDRMTFEQSLKGRTQSALALRLNKLPADFIQRFEMEPDWDSKMQILAEGEEAARTQNLDLYKPREMTTPEGERLVYNPKTGAFRFAPDTIGDEVVTRPITDETGEVIGHAMRSGDKWVRIPESRQQSRFEEIKYRGLQKQLDDIVESKSLTTNEKRIKAFEAQEAKIRAEMQAIESRTVTPTPTPQTKAPPKVGEIRDGYEYIGPNPGDPNSWRKVQ